MLKEDICILQTLVQEYGSQRVALGLIRALNQEADYLSDLGLKEKALATISLAEDLQEIVGD
jgi:hypothetical protein